ncbi:hypothetical protein FGIG_10201 [Fasciola gigantica]|uniref:Uncharacterized protein n=1 Tax=Fasciola gigantica TaxID=46835 RepID=A0A504YVY9_FASGI|nr:hypothetical protein FGIG_10201 [Fasciola gigantica]
MRRPEGLKKNTAPRSSPSTSRKEEGKATEHMIVQKSPWTKPVNTLSVRQSSSPGKSFRLLYDASLLRR